MQKILIALFLVLFTGLSINAQALEHKPKQLFISPELSVGTPIIVNQNNYGYSELDYELTFGGQAGVMVGWDYFLKQSFKTGIIVSKWGQHYNDILGDKRVEKNINNYYVQIPATYKHVFGRKRGYDHEVFSPYVFGSIRVGYLFSSNVDFFREQANGNMQEEDLVTFVTEGGQNINTDEIMAMGNPSSDKKLFFPIDINLEVGGGYQYFITRRISLFAEVHFASSILDINNGEWRFRNNKNNYSASYNMYGGIKMGANIYLFKNSR